MIATNKGAQLWSRAACLSTLERWCVAALPAQPLADNR